MWYVSFTMHVQVIEAENSITLAICTSTNIFIALRWHSEMILGFANGYPYQEVNT